MTALAPVRTDRRRPRCRPRSGVAGVRSGRSPGPSGPTAGPLSPGPVTTIDCGTRRIRRTGRCIRSRR